MPERRSFFEKLKNNRRLRELGKDIVIGLLVVSAVFLANKGGLLGAEQHPLRELWGSLAGKDGGDAVQSAGYVPAATPLCLVLTPQDSSHCAILYGDQRLSPMYERFSAVLGEALGSSLTPESVTREAWLAALRGGGLYIDYVNPQPLAVLASWLGTELSGGAGESSARRLLLAKNFDSVALFYLDAKTGGAFRCATALSWSAVSEKLADCVPNGAVFNFERAEPFANVDDCMLLLGENRTLPAYSVFNAMPTDEAGVDALLAALGVNGAAAKSYTEKDGTRVCVEGDAVVRLGADGVVRLTGGSGGGESLSAADAIERARLLAEETLGARAGEAGLTLAGVSYDGKSGEYSVRFDFSLSGLAVAFADGEGAAELTLRGGGVTSARLVFRAYSATGGTEQPLSSVQAAAITERKGGGEPQLAYCDDMGAVAVRWLIK